MMCSFCSQTIEKALMRTKGVKGVNVSLAHEEALIEHDSDQIGAEEIKRVLKGLGYTVRDPRKIKDFEEEDRILKQELRRMIFGWSFAVAATIFMVINWLDVTIPYQKWIMFAMATITVFGGGAHILQMSFRALRRWIFNQHVLLIFGTLGAYASGIVGFFYNIPDFFPPAIYLTAFHLLSGYLSQSLFENLTIRYAVSGRIVQLMLIVSLITGCVSSLYALLRARRIGPIETIGYA
ncbi:MAG: cation transporter [Desulfobacterales bacterium]|nr:cation transporter [Desulfobacterales bacterium]